MIDVQFSEKIEKEMKVQAWVASAGFRMILQLRLGFDPQTTDRQSTLTGVA